MIVSAVVLQILLPLVLLWWLVYGPKPGFLGLAIQILSTGLVILALGLASLWLIIPRWVVILYGVTWLTAFVIGIRRLDRSQRWPSRAGAKIGLVFIAALGVLSAYVVWVSTQARQPPIGVEIIDIPLPLGPGDYFIAHGGSRQLVNGHMMTLDQSIDRFRAYRGQSYGLDIVKLGRLGLRVNGLQPRNPDRYNIFGQPVISPCNGTVIESRNDRPDMPVPVMDTETIAGNHVLLHCGDFVLLMAHFHHGSVQVNIGDSVKTGDLLGRVGNSGKSSEPHLHLSAQRMGSRAAPFSGEPLALTINGDFLIRNDRVRQR